MAKQEPGDFPAGDIVFLDRGDGNSALLHLHGATLISWKCHSVENLFLSSTSVFDNKKAIRGGVPIAFPNFGPWPLGPQHGFARIKRWTVAVPPTKDAHGDVLAVLTLEDDEETRAMWDYKFKLVYTLVLSEKKLVSTLVIHNTDTKSLGFTTLLHTYFRVSDIDKTTVEGLKGLKYIDKITGGKDVIETRDLVTVDRNYDRVYKDAPQIVVISSGPEPSRKIEVKSFNFPDVVVWNPWDVKAKEMGDFDDEGYKEMVCVEVGKVVTPVTLTAGSQYECSQTFTSML
ncbi:glucose-6-phosphate 1-epimerase [Plakobranchus ocellatus]|uniref:glucose-6-phosphate 1-epimerase n=1 Tax=Plakobranchus ocellatus TaxID=259542 RepID=A0AAV4E1H9_9GAST|nr:glucose-6-phosphate 1-epimerase [Plakobranchus ocellatus]